MNEGQQLASTLSCILMLSSYCEDITSQGLSLTLAQQNFYFQQKSGSTVDLQLCDNTCPGA